MKLIKRWLAQLGPWWKRARTRAATIVCGMLRAELPPFTIASRRALVDLALQWQSRQAKYLDWHKKAGIKPSARTNGMVEAYQTAIQELGTTVHMLAPKASDGQPTDMIVGMEPAVPACPQCHTEVRFGRWTCPCCQADLRATWEKFGEKVA